MDGKLRRQLEEKYQTEIDKAAQQLLKDCDPTQVGATIKQVENYSKLLGAMKPAPRREKFWALGVALLCLIIAGLLWSLRVRSTAFLLNVQSDAVRLKLTKQWSYEESFSERQALPTSAAEIANADEINRAGHSCGTKVSVRGGKVQLTRLLLAAGAEIDLAGTQDNLALSAQKGRAEGELTFIGSAEITSDGDSCGKKTGGKTPRDIPQNISFNSEVKGAQPMSLQIRPPITWPLRNIEVEVLDFSQETVPGSGEFETTIRQGTITLFDTLKTETLQEGDRLRLEGVQGKCSKLWADGGVNLICELSANKILMGPRETERNLSPSWLEYLYHKQSLAFLWSVMTFLCGTLWGIRQIILRAE